MNSPNYVNNCNYDGAYNVLTKVTIIDYAIDSYLNHKLSDLGINSK